MRDLRERLLDILEAIERIEKYTIRGRDAFEQDELIQTWIVHHLQIIGRQRMLFLIISEINILISHGLKLLE